MIEIPHYVQAVDGVSAGRFIGPNEWITACDL
jgi:hypothetical protein